MSGNLKSIISGLKTILSTYNPVDWGEGDQTVDPSGSVYVAVGSVEQIAPGIPDYKLGITIAGQTLADDDPAKTKINTLFSSVFTTLSAQTPATLSTATGADCELWIMTSTTAPTGETGRVFTINYDLTIQNIQL